MAFFVDAIEYAGPDVPAVVGGARVPVRHHAFDTDTGLLAHGPAQPRVAFPDPQRSWTSVADASAACPACRTSVIRTVGKRIDRQLRAVLAVVDDQRWIWLYPPAAARQPTHPSRPNKEKR